MHTGLAALAGALGLLCWLLTTALPGSSGTGELPSDTAPPPHEEKSAVPPGTPRDTGMQPPREWASRPGPLPSPETALASFAAAAPTQSRTSLPTPSEELAADGLPTTAMHCSLDGGVLTCGSCRTDGDCPPGQGCVPNRETRRMECTSSECEEDAHCPPGFVCRTGNNPGTGSIIRRCLPEGVRREGETCDTGYVSRDGACREGLRCVSGVCGVPCELDDPRSCPSGYTCEEDPDGPGCVPDCQKLGCPPGQQCKRITDSKSQCMEQVVGACPETPCAEGQQCIKWWSRGRGAFWCARACNPIMPDSCPSGYVCGRASPTTSACFRKCQPQDPYSCGRGWICTTVSEDLSLWGCGLDHG